MSQQDVFLVEELRKSKVEDNLVKSRVLSISWNSFLIWVKEYIWLDIERGK